MSKKEKLCVKKTVEHMRGACVIVEDKRKMPWYMAIPIAGAMAISAISGGIVALGQGNIKEKNETVASDSYEELTEQEDTGNNEEKNNYEVYVEQQEIPTEKNIIDRACPTTSSNVSGLYCL